VIDEFSRDFWLPFPWFHMASKETVGWFLGRGLLGG
jgi:hypothetical protein